MGARHSRRHHGSVHKRDTARQLPQRREKTIKQTGQERRDEPAELVLSEVEGRVLSEVEGSTRFVYPLYGLTDDEIRIIEYATG